MIVRRLLACVACLFVVASCTHRASQPASARRAPSPRGPYAGPQVVDAQLVSATAGWARTEHQLLWTDDAGRSWSDVTAPGASSDLAVDIHADGHAWVVSVPSLGVEEPPDHTVDVTVYRGRSPQGPWRAAKIPRVTYGFGIGKPQVTFTDARHGWVLVDTGSHAGFTYDARFRTDDGGTTWRPTKQIPRPQHPSTGRRRWTIARDGGCRSFKDDCWESSALFASDDGGAHWYQLVPRSSHP
jgi:photosystem II stability/assembly factor-like uncharacterized protein